MTPLPSPRVTPRLFWPRRDREPKDSGERDWCGGRAEEIILTHSHNAAARKILPLGGEAGEVVDVRVEGLACS
jgi:hypothetical protein